MGPNAPCSKLIYLVNMDYGSRIGSTLTFVHKGILVIIQGCIGVSEQDLWIGLID